MEDSLYDCSLLIVAVTSDNFFLNLNYTDRLLSSLLSVTKELHSHGTWTIATSKERLIIPVVYLAYVH